MQWELQNLKYFGGNMIRKSICLLSVIGFVFLIQNCTKKEDKASSGSTEKAEVVAVNEFSDFLDSGLDIGSFTRFSCLKFIAK